MIEGEWKGNYNVFHYFAKGNPDKAICGFEKKNGVLDKLAFPNAQEGWECHKCKAKLTVIENTANQAEAKTE